MIRKSLEFTADSDYKSLKAFLRNKNISSRTINELKRLERLLINGAPAYAIAKVKKDDIITVLFLEENRISCDPQDIPINIVYEDLDILVVCMNEFLE